MTWCKYVITDLYGRKPVHIGFHLIYAVLGIGLAFSDSFTTFFVLRAMMGFTIPVSLTHTLKTMESKFKESFKFAHV